MSSPALDPPLDINTLALFHNIRGHKDSDVASAVQLIQTEHRINLVKYWSINAGERILELGCGQGDTTTVLAAAVGHNGHVVAVDPASLDYGSPFTLGQAQAHLKSTRIGPRITFVQQDPVGHLSSLSTSGTPTYTSAILAHMTYYLPNRDTLLAMLTAIKPHASRLCLAEHSLVTPLSRPAAYPHVLAVLTQAALASYIPIAELTGNIRTVLSPEVIKEIATEAGWKLEKEEVAPPPEKLQEGRWEVSVVLDDSFNDDVEKYVEDDRQKRVLYAMRDAVKLSKASLGEQKIMAMDVWSAVFVHA